MPQLTAPATRSGGKNLWVVLTVLAVIMAPFTIFITFYAPLVALLALFLTTLSTCNAVVAFRRRKWAFAMHRLVPLFAALIIFPDFTPRAILEAGGFRLDLTLSGNIPEECKRIIYIDDGGKEEICDCGIRRHIFSPRIYHYILFDPTGQIAKDPASRSRAWGHAVNLLPEGHMIARSDLTIRRIYGPYYDVIFTVGDMEG